MHKMTPVTKGDKITILLKERLHTLKHFVLLASILGCVILAAELYDVKGKNNELKETLVKLEEIEEGLSDPAIAKVKIEQIDTLKEEVSEVKNINNTLSFQISGLIESLQEMEDQNRTLLDMTADYETELENLNERVSKYERYKYAVIDPDSGRRTDLTYDDLITLEEVCKRWGIDPDFQLACIMTESRATASAASGSGAIGLAQVTGTTGRYVYQQILRKGAFDRSLLYNKSINIEVSSAYWRYLLDRNSSLTGAIRGYRGCHDQGYINKLSKWLAKAGKTLGGVEQSMRSMRKAS